MLKQFGALPNKTDLDNYSRSVHFNGKKFVNKPTIEMGISMRKVPYLIYKQFITNKLQGPSSSIPIVENDFTRPYDGERARAFWYGHSALFLQVRGLHILIDPMLGQDAAPISPFPIRRFSTDTLQLINGFPTIDVVLISHDHYDHLDYKSIKKLIPITKQFFVALGVKRHLIKWGVSADRITEFDRWEVGSIGGIDIIFSPTRHFSGRGLQDRQMSLWGGWIIKSPDENILFSGDGGYGRHFREIGREFGPFDLVFIECGQYSDLWPEVHMTPEEAVQASIDVGAQYTVPVHWGAFTLAQHKWTEPPEQFLKAALKQGLNIIFPPIGQGFSTDTSLRSPWWREYESVK